MYTNIHPYSVFLRNCIQTAFKLACTAFMALHTMLVYRNQQFGAYTVQTGMYSIRMTVAGGGRRQEAGGKWQEAGGRRQEAGGKRQDC